MNLLTDPRVVNLFVGWRHEDASYRAEVILDGHAYTQTGFYSLTEAYRWLCVKVARHPPATRRAA